MTELEEHKDHDIQLDTFSEVFGVTRLTPGNAYCVTCDENIEAIILGD